MYQLLKIGSRKSLIELKIYVLIEPRYLLDSVDTIVFNGQQASLFLP